jgi:hypothetical protein
MIGDVRNVKPAPAFGQCRKGHDLGRGKPIERRATVSIGQELLRDMAAD